MGWGMVVRTQLTGQARCNEKVSEKNKQGNQGGGGVKDREGLLSCQTKNALDFQGCRPRLGGS